MNMVNIMTRIIYILFTQKNEVRSYIMDIKETCTSNERNVIMDFKLFVDSLRKIDQ